jgi:hypothetical protein
MPLGRVVISAESYNKYFDRCQHQACRARRVLTEGTVVLQGLGDFAAGQVAKVEAGGSLGELQVAFGGSDPTLVSDALKDEGLTRRSGFSKF